MVARAASYDHQILRPIRSVDEEAFTVARVPRRRSESDESETARGNFRRLLRRVEARGKALGDRISGFWSREAEEHVCGVGFDRRRLDVHRSEKLSHGFA